MDVHRNSKSVRVHVIAAKAFALGAVFLASIAGALLSERNSSLQRISLYTTATVVFHMLEFLTTAMYNTAEVDDDSFILCDADLYYVFVASIVETCLVHHFFNYSTLALIAGVSVILLGQTCRTVAMYTAGESFNHYVQRQHVQKHKLVTFGIYKYLRHPSYFGYFWWYVGMQLLLENWVMALVGAYKLHKFFLARIKFEEEFLRSFFGDEYEKYARATRVRIPGIA